MIKELNDIKNSSTIGQGTSADIITISALKYNSNPLGSGSFGDVHEIVEINANSSSQYVVKIIKESTSADHAYEVIQLLHQKIKKDRLNQATTIYQEYPGLMGLPFAVFRAFDVIENKEVVAMVMFNLQFLGYLDFGNDDQNDLGNDNLDLIFRILISQQLAKTIDFLHRNMFIHSDLSENALWIHPGKQLLALIDFDSGFHYDKQAKATTIGKFMHWASVSVRKIIQLGNSSLILSTEDRIEEENWVVANAIFELLFTVPPFFFLMDAEEITLKQYFKNNKWPNIDKINESINLNNLSGQQEIIQKINGLEDLGCTALIELFKKTFNEGFFDSGKRPSVKDWFNQLLEVSKSFELFPSINKFNSNKKNIKRKNESIKLSWDFAKAEYLTLNGRVLPLFSNTEFLNIEDTIELTLTATSSIGKSSQTIKIKAEKIQPVFKSVLASEKVRLSEDPIIISWVTDFANKVVVEGINSNFSGKDQITVHPTQKTTYKLIAFGNFDQKEEQTISVDVIYPVIKDFDWKVDINKGIDNVKLFWETEFAVQCKIVPMIEDVPVNGETEFKINSKTEFELIASGLFGQVTRRIVAVPFCAPIIETIFMKAPPIEISTHVDVRPLEINANMPEILFNPTQLNVNLDFQTHFTPHEVMFNTKLPDFTNNNLLFPKLKTNWFSSGYQKFKRKYIKSISNPNLN